MRPFSPLQKEVAGALIGLVRSLDESNRSIHALETIIEGLKALNCVEDWDLERQVQRIHAEKYRAVPDCAVCQNPCGRTEDYNLDDLEQLAPPLPELKYALLDALARYAERVEAPGEQFQPILEKFMEGLFAVGYDWFSPEEIKEKTDQL